MEALSALEKGELIPQKQDDSRSTYAPLIRKSMGELDFKESAERLELLVRGLNPWPSAYTFYRGKQLKIWEARACTAADKADEADKEDKADKADAIQGAEPGTILAAGGDRLVVAAGEGALWIQALQLEGKRRMSTHDFLLGLKPEPGERLGR